MIREEIENEIIKDIKQAFGVYGLGDIKHNIDRPLSCFILCFCFLDQLAAYRYNNHESHSRFNTIIRKHFPQYNELQLYSTLRNKLIHTYSVTKGYRLISSDKIETKTLRHIDILNTYIFVPEIEEVYKKIEAEFDRPGSEARNCAILFHEKNPIISSKLFEIMNYNNEEAEILINHYLPLMKGKDLDDNKQLQVQTIIKKPNPDGTFFVHVYPQRMRTVVQFYREISDAARYLNLETPEDVLKSHS